MSQPASVESPTPEPVIEQPPVQAEESVSIADHAEQFGPQSDKEPRPANTGQFAPKPADARHKAQSQRATPEDVQEINKLTKELRDIEQKVADKDPDAKLAPRVRTLRRQIAALKALDAPEPAKPAETPKPAPIAAPASQPKEAKTDGVVAGFDKPKPKFEDFSKEEDPLDAYYQAIADWQYDRREFAKQSEAQQAQAKHAEQEVFTTAANRIEEFKKTAPDFDKVTGEFLTRNLPPILLNALVRHDKFGEFVYYLGQHSDVADELVLLTHGKPLDDDSVALMQRRLSNYVKGTQAATTGSAAPARPYNPPRPPNPVRTGPTKTADEPPAEAQSIAEHARYHGKRR